MLLWFACSYASGITRLPFHYIFPAVFPHATMICLLVCQWHNEVAFPLHFDHCGLLCVIFVRWRVHTAFWVIYLLKLHICFKHWWQGIWLVCEYTYCTKLINLTGDMWLKCVGNKTVSECGYMYMVLYLIVEVLVTNDRRCEVCFSSQKYKVTQQLRHKQLGVQSANDMVMMYTMSYFR